MKGEGRGGGIALCKIFTKPNKSVIRLGNNGLKILKITVTFLKF